MIISVIMPVYNGAMYLREAIDSILSQTYEDFEFLIFNDGSTDDTIDIIGAYRDSRIKLINSTTNIGLIANLNKGLEVAKGKYIARMDADDIAYPERFEKQVRFLEQNDDIGACGTWALRFTGKSTMPDTKSLWQTKKTHQDIIYQSLMRCPIIHPTVMIRSEIVKKYHLRYLKEYFRAEDYKFWFDFSRHSKLANIPEVLLLYRDHASNISTNKTLQSELSAKIRSDELLNFYKLKASSIEIGSLYKFLNNDKLADIKDVDCVFQKIINTTPNQEKKMANNLLRSYYEVFLDNNPPRGYRDLKLFKYKSARVIKRKTIIKYIIKYIFGIK